MVCSGKMKIFCVINDQSKQEKKDRKEGKKEEEEMEWA